MNRNKYLSGSRLWLLAVTGALGGAMLYAAPVTPQQALSEAIAYRQSHTSNFRLPASGASPNLAYTATGTEGNCFYVFNTPGAGFTIVSADDRLPVILGFSENGEFDYNLIPPAMRWWLSQYTQEITSFLTVDPEISSSVRRVQKASPGDLSPIEPILHTQWDQTAPYNNLCPMDASTGRRSVTGCVATAMAQIMRHYEWPINPTGQNGGYVFSGTTLEWDNMLDTYTDYNYTSEQATAVATLMRQCGAAVDMMYSSYASGAYSNDVPNALATYFDYNKSMELKWRDYYSQSEWNKIVYAELEANRPVYYSGQSDQGGHAFVCDGYLENNFFHFNWGRSGYQDGSFLLNALTPATGGTGSYGGGYNANQSIITGLRPSQGETERQVTLLSTGAFTYNGSSFVITDSPDMQNLIYNPFPYSLSFTDGLKIVAFDDPDKVTYVKGSSSTTISQYYGFDSFSAKVPSSLPDGKYKVFPAMYVSQSDKWYDIQIPVGLQRYVTLVVSGGQSTLTNDGPEAEARPQMLSGLPEHIEPLYSDVPFAFRLPLANVAEGEFNDYVYIGIYNDDDDFAPFQTMQLHANIPAYSTIDLTLTSDPIQLKPGRHSIYITDSKYQDMIEPITVTLTEGGFKVESATDVKVSHISPSFITTGTVTGFNFVADNSSDSDITLTGLTVSIRKATDMSEVVTFKSEEDFTIAAETSVTINLAPVTLSLPAGDYMTVLTDEAGSTISLPHPLKVYGEVFKSEGVTYQVIDEAKHLAHVTGAETSENLSHITVAAAINGYDVVELTPTVFTFNDLVTHITLPAGITTIQPASFYGTSALTSLTMLAPAPPAVYDEAFAEDAYGRVWVSGPDNGVTNLYNNDAFWGQFEMSNWTIIIPSDITVVSGLLTDPATGSFYSPYYVAGSENLTFDVEAAAERSIRAVYEYNGTSVTTDFWRTVKLPPLNGSTGKVTLSTTDSSHIDTTVADHRTNVYSVDGTLVLRDATVSEIHSLLPAGVYIAGNQKIVVR